nr:GNAT family N-acetyltransferase [Amycolatopsis anabasis]
MTDPAELRPAAAVPGVSLERLERTSPLIRSVAVRIGTPYEWPSVSWTDAQWGDFLAHPRREFWLIRHGEEIAGLADFEGQDGGQVEITTFGLVPESVGRGIGGHALTLVLERAWKFPHSDGEVRRVWLHTSTLDHPHAMPNYRKRGLRPFRTELSER